jgi:hypothetical protein
LINTGQKYSPSLVIRRTLQRLSSNRYMRTFVIDIPKSCDSCSESAASHPLAPSSRALMSAKKPTALIGHSRNACPISRPRLLLRAFSRDLLSILVSLWFPYKFLYARSIFLNLESNTLLELRFHRRLSPSMSRLR